jgi:hypothetical protein
MSNDVAGSNSLADLAVGIHVEHEEALWSATVRVPQDYTIISITRGIHASNKVRGPSRTKEPLPFGNLPFGSPSPHRELCCCRLLPGLSTMPRHWVALHCHQTTETETLCPLWTPMLAIRPAGCILGRESTD